MAERKLTLAQRQRRNKIYEISAYVIAALLVLFGIILICLAIAGDYLGKDNFIKIAQANTLPIFGVVGFSWRYYGIILVSIGLVIYIIAAYFASKSKDQKANLEETKSKRTTLKLDNLNKGEQEVNK